jgi:hypothetical protein
MLNRTRRLGLSIFLSLLSFAPISHAAPISNPAESRIDDGDLAGPAPIRRQEVSSELVPDSIETATGTNPLALSVLRMDHGLPSVVSELTFTFSTSGGNIRLATDAQGMIHLPAQTRCATGKIHAVAELINNQFEVQSTYDRHNYRISADLPCSGSAQMSFRQDSNAGQALGIWQIATRARAALNASIGLSFWNSRITFAWPADGDYYSAGTVHITHGDYWDVVGHEMGHAIYDQGGLGRFGGGAHKIDECYSNTLALSEGWASFFSGWVSVGLSDPDAKFEYMVPRRAPIRFETIPADVCKGESNEWRVTGFFWDLIDLHVDGENMNESFARLWNAMRNSHVSSTSQAMLVLKKAGIDENGLRAVWSLNFQTQAQN